MSFFNYNGKLLAADTPVISVNNRGLRYGDGLFETMKLLNGNLIFANEHFARLWKGLQLLQFDVPKYFTPEKLQDDIAALAKKNQHEKAARVRLTVFRGAGGLYDAANHQPNYSIETWALQNEAETINSNGLVLGIYEDAKKSCDALSNIKHNNYLPYVMAALKAKKEKWNDALLLNNYGRVCDTTIANIFFIKDETVYTPSLNEGGVAGILRQHVLGWLKTEGYNSIQKEITVDELLEADEVFLTNSIYNLRWVQRINNTAYSNALTQKIYTALLPTIS
jgi:branched-chain amino acid aminotransferase